MTEINIQQRVFEFASEVIKYLRKIQIKDEAMKILFRQLFRSSASIGANLEEASAGQSKADFVSKCAIASKEARETFYWLKLIKKAELVNSEKLDMLTDESRQIVAILSAIVKNAQQSPNRQKVSH